MVSTVETEQTVSEVEERSVDKSSALEQTAKERRERLKRIREWIEENGEDAETSKCVKPTLRSYEPASDIGEKKNDVDLLAVEKEITEQLADAQDISTIEQIDLNTLAPRKVDWDLKRDISKRMEKLERRTERAIAELIRQRLKAGKTELTDAVSATAYSELKNGE